MSPLRLAALAAFALAALATHSAPSRAAAPAPAGAKAVTFPYPAKAPLVVQVNGLGAARERFRTMLKAALPNDAAAAEKEIDAALDELLAGRKLDAVPKDGRAFFVVHDIAALFDNTAAVSFLVPVTSYKAFRDTFLTAEERKTFEAGKNGVDDVKLTAFGQERAVHVVDLKDYVAISPDRVTAETFAGKYTKATTAAMSPQLARTFADSDIGAYVNLEVVNDLYGQQIKAFKGLIDFAFMQAGMGGVMSKRQMEAAKTMLQGLIQAVEDGRGVAFGLEFRPEGVAVRVQAQFAEDTDSTALLKSESPGPLADVAKLPAGLGQYGGTRFGKKLAAAVAGLSPQFSPAEDDEKGNAALDKAQKELLAAGLRGEVSASGAARASLTVSSYAEPKRAAAALVASYRAVKAGGRIQNVVLKEDPKITEAARKHRGFTFTEIRTAYDFEASVKNLPDEAKEAALAQMKRLTDEKATAWVGTDGKSVVQLGAKDWNAAAAVLDDYLGGQKGVGGAAGYKLTRKHLPPEVNHLMMLETSQTATMLVESLRAVSGTIPNMPRIGKLKPVKGEATFVGLAVVLKGDTATFTLFVPGGAIAAAQEMMKGLFRKVE